MSAVRNESINEHSLNILAGIPVLKNIYGLSVDEDDYLDIAIDVLRDIKYFGNTEYLALIDIDDVGNALLPCNVHSIDALVTKKMGLKNYNTRVKYDTHRLLGTDQYYTASSIMASAIPHPDPVVDNHPGTQHPLEVIDQRGLGVGQTTRPSFDGYISFHIVDNKTISVDIKYAGETLALAYTGISVDEEGFPLITRKQSNAIAAKTARSIVMSKSLAGDQKAAQLLSFLVQESGRLIQAASIPEGITDNEIDSLLDAKTSFNRKRYGRPSKYGK